MSVSGKTVAKNVGVMMSSQVITWGLTLLVTLFLPRYLGATAIGQLNIALALWSLVGVLIVFGMDTYLAKEVARQPEQTPVLLGTSLLLRGGLFLIGCCAVALYVAMVDPSPVTIYTAIIVGFGQFVSLFNTACMAVLQGLETMEYISLSSVAGKVTNTALSLAVIFVGWGVYAVAIVTVIAGVASALLLYVGLRRSKVQRLRVERSYLRSMLRLSSPYLVVSVTLVAYQQINTLIIASVVDEQSVGWFSTASTLFGTLLFVPVVFATAIFPAVSRSYANSPTLVPRLIGRSIDLMFLVAVPIGMGIMVVAPNLINLVYGPEFAPTAQILTIMATALIFTYLNILYGQVLIATDRPGIWTKIMIGAAVAMFVFAWLLVPWTQRTFGNGALGGAFSFMLTELMMTIAGTLLLPRNVLTWSNVRAAALTVVASTVMLVVCWPLRNMLLPIPIAVGVVSFTIMVLVLRIISTEEMKFLQDLWLQVVRRIRPGAKDQVSIS